MIASGAVTVPPPSLTRHNGNERPAPWGGSLRVCVLSLRASPICLSCAPLLGRPQVLDNPLCLRWTELAAVDSQKQHLAGRGAGSATFQ